MPLIAIEPAEIVTRAANEGIPIAAIARMTKNPFDEVCDALHDALGLGRIVQMPKADWPPTVLAKDRQSTIKRSMNPDDIHFEVKKRFRLTPLEAGFLTVLLLNEHVDKVKLHNVVEQQRMHRSTRPDGDETDPKIVDVIICKLRKKLQPFAIETSWGNGYYIAGDMTRKIFAHLGAANDNEAGTADGSGTSAPGKQGETGGD